MRSILNENPSTQKRSPRLRDEVDGVHDPAGDGLVIVGLAHRHPSSSACSTGKRPSARQAPAPHGGDQVAVEIRLVEDLADDLLDDVLDGDETVGSAVFVDDDRHLLSLRLHLPEQRDDVFRLGDEHGLVHELGDGIVDAPVHQRPDEVLIVDDAHDAVNVIMVHGKTRIARPPMRSRAARPDSTSSMIIMSTRGCMIS